MTRSSKETYRERRRRANKICRERIREMLKKQTESIEVGLERVDASKYYQTMNIFRKVFQPRLKACKDNSGKLIEGDDKILEHWVRDFKTQLAKEYSDEESDEEVFLTAELHIKEPSQEEMEKTICNLKINEETEEDETLQRSFI